MSGADHGSSGSSLWPKQEKFSLLSRGCRSWVSVEGVRRWGPVSKSNCLSPMPWNLWRCPHLDALTSLRASGTAACFSSGAFSCACKWCFSKQTKSSEVGELSTRIVLKLRFMCFFSYSLHSHGVGRIISVPDVQISLFKNIFLF